MDELSEKDTLATYKERYKVLEEYWADNHALALAEMKFAAGDQWPEDIKKLRRLDNRPCLTVDKSGQYIRQVVNDSRQNRPAIKVRPIDDEGDIEVAEALQGIVQHVADRSNADDAYDWAIEFDNLIGGHIQTGNLAALQDFQKPGELAKLAHPSHEHYLPLLYAAGAVDEGEPVRSFNESFQAASISMRSAMWG